MREGVIGIYSPGGYLWFQRCRYFTVRWLEIIAVLWYNSNSKKATSERNLWFAWGGRKYGVWIATTVLTIYGSGLRGNSAKESTRKHRFRTRKPRKAPEIKEKIGINFFGTSMPSVRILSLRPHTNNPNTFRIGETFGFFVSIEYPNFNAKK